MPVLFDRGRLVQAFEMLGADLARRGLFVELAIYGGGAIMLQFAWRRSTEDVDAVVREGHDERALAPSVAHVAGLMGFDANWLNDAVGMFTPLDEPDALFELSGTYPADAPPGLRTFVAKPHYLLAMKLQALRAVDRGTRDLDDARALAAGLGLTDIASLDEVYVSVFGEAPPTDIRHRFRDVLAGAGP